MASILPPPQPQSQSPHSHASSTPHHQNSLLVFCSLKICPTEIARTAAVAHPAHGPSRHHARHSARMSNEAAPNPLFFFFFFLANPFSLKGVFMNMEFFFSCSLLFTSSKQFCCSFQPIGHFNRPSFCSACLSGDLSFGREFVAAAGE